MIHNIIRNLIYFFVFVLIQVLFLNHIYFLRMATPFLYIYFLLKLPVGMSRGYVLIFSFLTGLVIDSFANTPGMHTAACTLAGFLRDPLIRFFMGKDLPEGIYPSFRTFGYGGFLRYTLSFVVIHHMALFLIESFSLYEPLYLLLRILGSLCMTTLLICIVEAFNISPQKSGEKQ
ncbi:rod shape-determining protein MreD [Parabacteroides sp. 52]|uniref:rod shape-determining protein MreD n=1 Tax=unclassified Parabacteroides TaxID=2649774 RepID=UPI0013D6F45D|nr:MULTISPECIES: rod shape-determining protein MreD [unclassified Parabacteroides]MDH6534605.1 rod shape-determining protein MreD [Parabacteroides sp. PM5-20]NDV55162.1 rod shape-determining protein MreD [Parabacteroides sp. 52]